MGAFWCHGNQSFDPICPKTLSNLCPTLKMLHIKFDQHWPTGFRDIGFIWGGLDLAVPFILFYSEHAELKSSAAEQLSRSTPDYSTPEGGVVGITWPVLKKHGGPISASTRISFWKIYFCISFQTEVKFTNMIDNILYFYCVFLLFFRSIYPTEH